MLQVALFGDLQSDEQTRATSKPNSLTRHLKRHFPILTPFVLGVLRTADIQF